MAGAARRRVGIGAARARAALPSSEEASWRLVTFRQSVPGHPGWFDPLRAPTKICVLRSEAPPAIGEP